MDESADMAAEAIVEQDWQWLGMIFNENQELMAGMGLNNPALETIIIRLQNDPGIFGAKISGSGLGDCAVGLGRITSALDPYPVIPVAIAEQGVTVNE
jgi:mevalonate kinase